MIAFGSSITKPEVYRRCAEPGIRRAAEADSKVLAYNAAGSIFRSYNLLLEKASELDDLEALVLLHQDAELVDDEFCHKVRLALEDDDVGVVGCVGAVDVRSIAWWEGSATWASFSHRYSENGGGDVESLTWKRDDMPPYAHTGEVDTVDGFVLVLSPWTVRNVRFDESLGQFHGYDFDFCLQVRAAGRKIVTEDFRVVHHHSLELVDDLETWIEAHMRVAEKWDGRMSKVGMAAGDWKQRARRAEAEAAAARLQYWSVQLQHEARMKEITHSLSWRMTAPLRFLSLLARGFRKAWRERRSLSSI